MTIVSAPRGHRTAGEDPDRLARTDDAVVRAARRRLPDLAQRGRRPGDVVRAHRVTVHRRDGDRRLGDARAHFRRQDPAQGVRQPHGLDARGRERIEYPSPRLGDGKSSPAHSALKTPDLPPLLNVRRADSTVMARSTDLHMS